MDRVRGAGIAVLGPGDTEDPYRGIEDAAGVVAGVRPYDRAVMDRAPGLRVIARTGIGCDSVDMAAATERGIRVCNNPDGPTIPAAEHTVALMLAAAKRLTIVRDDLRRGDRPSIDAHSSVELAGKLLGVVGFGRIARRVAAAAAALGMKVTAYDPFLADDRFEGVTRSADLEGMLARADVVTIHVPLTDLSLHMFDRRTLGTMKKGAILINTARGGVVNTDALLEAVTAGHLRAVGLDVTDPEPLPADHPLLRFDNVLITPHVASWTQSAKRRMLLVAAEQVMSVLTGHRPDHLINPQVLSAVPSPATGRSDRSP